MDNKIKYNAYLLCQRIRELTQQLDKSIRDMPDETFNENNISYKNYYGMTPDKPTIYDNTLDKSTSKVYDKIYDKLGKSDRDFFNDNSRLFEDIELL